KQVKITGQATASVGASGEAIADAFMVWNGLEVADACDGSGTFAGCGPASLIFRGSQPTVTNTAVPIRIVAFSSAGVHGAATASADPFFFIDPSTPDADQYTLVFTDGIGPGTRPPSGAPEPDVLGLLLIALGVWNLGRYLHLRTQSLHVRSASSPAVAAMP